MDTQAIILTVQYDIEQCLQDLSHSSQASPPIGSECRTSIEAINDGPSSRSSMLVVPTEGTCCPNTEGNTSTTNKEPTIRDGRQWRKQNPN
mmetsp:Transcript_54973/g.62217  ORF Transcript_54973/g.62217 Transcript_54973/m.62217 type:complete len:91 (-) Transcript_54973:244-516(-)